MLGVEIIDGEFSIAQGLARIHAGIVGALKDATVRERLIKDGAEIVGNKPDEAARFLKAEIARWGAVVKSAGLKAE